MKRFVLFFLGLLIFSNIITAQIKVIDATDNSPILAASILDASGNLIGITLINGDLPNIPKSAYPITVRCIGYEELSIETPTAKTWEMTPTSYELDEIVVIPIERNVLKQSFYVREYFSIHNDKDTVTFFIEHMAERFIPTTKDAKFGGNTSLRTLNSRCYSLFNIGGVDSVAFDAQSKFPSMLSLCELNDTQINAPESFKSDTCATKLYQESDKSGMSLIQKQNAQTFTSIEDELAGKKNHSSSPWALKLIGMTLDINKNFSIHTYQANDSYIYQPKDLIEASFVMEADGKGKHIRKILKSENPVIVRSMIEIYLVDNTFLSNDEAKQEYKDKDRGLDFTIPSTIPPLNDATKNMVTRAKNKK